MAICRRQTLALLASAAAAAALPFADLVPSAAAAPVPDAIPDEATIADAYVYLLGRALVIRQENIDSRVAGFAYNTIRYNPLGSTEFVNPNFDVAYLEAWIAVDDRTPAILDVPEIRGRYYTAQILDEWGEVIANINERTFPSKPFGTFALVRPGSAVAIPAGAGRIELHSRKAKLLGRVELKDDRDGAIRSQHQFRLAAPGHPAAAPPPAMPDFGNRALIGAGIFGDIDATLASALDVSPIAAEMQQKVRAVAAWAASGDAARATLDAQLRKVIPAIQDYALTKSAPYRDHWAGGAATGNYGRDYWLRTSINFAGIWANTPDEAVYFIATRDADESTLNGSHSYVIHFPAGRLPQSVVDAYWSVILVDVPGYRVVPNPLNRFNFNSESPLSKEPDGSLRIAIGPKPVDGVPDSNRLPSPSGAPFALTFRAYVPKDIVKRGAWRPPPVTMVA